MADSFNPYEERILGLKEKRALARKLQEGSMEAPQGQMVSGWYVAPSWTQQLARGLNFYAGLKGEEKAQKGIEDIGKERTAARESWMAQMPMATTVEGERQTGQVEGPRQEGIEGPMPAETKFVEGPMPGKTKAPTAEDYLSWSLRGYQIDPAAAVLGQKYGDLAVARENAAEERRSRAQQRLDELQVRLSSERLSEERQAELRREIERGRDLLARDLAAGKAQEREASIRLAAALRPAPQPQAPIAVIGPDGKPTYVAPGQAYGMAPYNPAAAKETKEQMQHVSDAKESNALLGQVLKVGPVATSSGLGSMVDTGLGFFGKSTPSAEAAASMKVLGASLTAKVPKMSGPQSDKDVAMYKEAAGNIADPSIPWNRKLAAIKTINEINNRQLGYSGITPEPLPGLEPQNAPVGLPSLSDINAEMARRSAKQAGGR